jgi:hypothetical protein
LLQKPAIVLAFACLVGLVWKEIAAMGGVQNKKQERDAPVLWCQKLPKSVG